MLYCLRDGRGDETFLCAGDTGVLSGGANAKDKMGGHWCDGTTLTVGVADSAQGNVHIVCQQTSTCRCRRCSDTFSFRAIAVAVHNADGRFRRYRHYGPFLIWYSTSKFICWSFCVSVCSKWRWNWFAVNLPLLRQGVGCRYWASCCCYSCCESACVKPIRGFLPFSLQSWWSFSKYRLREIILHINSNMCTSHSTRGVRKTSVGYTTS